MSHVFNWRMIPRTLDRILDGAMDAVERHGLAKLEMCDVSASARVSRGTVYRYFPNRDALVTELARREGQRFQEQIMAAIERAPAGPERVLVALEQATNQVREHRALQRLLETDPAFVLRALRAELPQIKAQFARLLGPSLAETHLVKRGVVSAAQLVDWMLRLMISAYLLPEAQKDSMAQGLTAVYRMLTAPLAPGGQARKTHPARASRRQARLRTERKRSRRSREQEK